MRDDRVEIIAYFQTNPLSPGRNFDFATLELGKVRQTDKLRVIALKVRDNRGRKWRFFGHFIKNGNDTWEIWGISGCEEPAKPVSITRLPEPVFDAGLSNGGFYATGFLNDPTTAIKKVRLGWRAGYEVEITPANLADVRFVPHDSFYLEDTLEDGTVIFLGGQRFSRPDTVEYYDELGNLLTSHGWHGGWGE